MEVESSGVNPPGAVMQSNLSHSVPRSWEDICRDYSFLADQRDRYAEVALVSPIAVFSPLHIPSFEVSLRRNNFYNALAEVNEMGHGVLLPRH